jgi:hypothetical protein
LQLVGQEVDQVGRHDEHGARRVPVETVGHFAEHGEIARVEVESRFAWPLVDARCNHDNLGSSEAGVVAGADFDPSDEGLAVCAHPYAAWAAQQMVEAMGPGVQARRLLRDRDGIYGRLFDERVRRLGLETVRIAPRSPWQNGYAERFVATLRRELLDHVIVLGERHLLRMVREHARYYNLDRPHMSLCGDAPAQRAVEGPETGKVIALPRVAGLHHRYSRQPHDAAGIDRHHRSRDRRLRFPACCNRAQSLALRNPSRHSYVLRWLCGARHNPRESVAYRRAGVIIKCARSAALGAGAHGRRSRKDDATDPAPIPRR